MLEAPPLTPGTRAPDAALAASDGSTVTLSDAWRRGGVVLIFYPGNNTPGCDRQLRELKDEFARFQALGISAFGVNPASAEEHRAYAAALELPFLLLSDPGLRLASAWNAVAPLGDQITRTVYRVDADGIVRFGARGMPGADITLEGLEEGR
jgi:peroxiredoxin Q/BCP